MAKTMTGAQPSMLKSAVTLWMKVTDPDSAAMSGWPSVPLALFAVTRLAAIGVAYVAVNWPGAPAKVDWIDALCRGTCAAAASVADKGYADVSTAGVFPLLALLAKASALVGIPSAVVLIAVSNLATVGAFLILYKIFQRLGDEQTAQWGVALIALYPFAIFQVTGGTDGLSLLFTSATILLGLMGNYRRAGIVAAIGMLADPFTVFAVFAMGSLLFRERHMYKKVPSQAAVAVGLPVLAVAAYCIFLAVRFGQPFAFLGAGAGRPVGMELLASMGQAGASRGLFGTALAAALVTIGAVCLVLRRPWFPLMAFALPWVFVMWTFARGGLGSHAATCWPAFLPLGAWLKNRPSLQMPAVGAFAIFFGCFLLLYARGAGLE